MGAGASVVAAHGQDQFPLDPQRRSFPTSPLSGVGNTNSYDMEPPSRFGTRSKHDSFKPGDILSVRLGHGKVMEGLMVERIDNLFVAVDFGSEGLRECSVEDCDLIVSSEELEVGDKVEAKPEGMNMYFVGKILRISEHGTAERNKDIGATSTTGAALSESYKRSIITKISSSGSGKNHQGRHKTVAVTRSSPAGAHASSITSSFTTASFTIDVVMEGDDPDDIEYNIPFENVRKLMSCRAMAVSRWHKAFMVVAATNHFKSVTPTAKNSIDSGDWFGRKSQESPEADESDEDGPRARPSNS